MYVNSSAEYVGAPQSLDGFGEFYRSTPRERAALFANACVRPSRHRDALRRVCNAGVRAHARTKRPDGTRYGTVRAEPSARRPVVTCSACHNRVLAESTVFTLDASGVETTRRLCVRCRCERAGPVPAAPDVVDVESASDASGTRYARHQ